MQRLHDEMSGAHDGGPFVTSRSSASCMSAMVSSSGAVPFGSFYNEKYFFFHDKFIQ